MDDVQRIEILKAVMNVSPRRRAEVVQCALDLMTLDMDHSERIKIIGMTAGLFVAVADEKYFITSIALRSITVGMNKSSRIKILEAVMAVADDKRSSVVNRAVFLMKAEMECSERIRVIRNVAGIVDESDLLLAQKVTTQEMGD